jgi:hypothetical protein
MPVKASQSETVDATQPNWSTPYIGIDTGEAKPPVRMARAGRGDMDVAEQQLLTEAEIPENRNKSEQKSQPCPTVKDATEEMRQSH